MFQLNTKIQFIGIIMESGNPVEKAYVDIVLKIDDNIIGYAVIKITKASEILLNFVATTLKSVIFPKTNGQYQHISEKYIETKIEKLKSA